MPPPASTEPAPSRLRLTDCTIDFETEVVERDGAVLPLTTREAALLRYLVARPGVVVSVEELHRAVWGMSEKALSRAALHTASRLRRKLEADPGVPRHLISIHGEGYRWGPAAARPGEPATPSPDPGRILVPDWSTPLFGRDRELAAVHDALRDGIPVVALVGPSGGGKTRLALEIARRGLPGARTFVLADFRDRAPSAPSQVQGAIVEGVADALGVRLESTDLPAATEQIGRALAARDGLVLMLDTFESVAVGSEVALAAWLRLAPQLRILVCSTVRLPLTRARQVAVGALDAVDALALFEHRVLEHLGEELSEPDRAVVGALVDRLDRLPLALELAAAQMVVLSPRALLERLPASLDGLEAGLVRSWSLLPEWAQVALAQLSVFRGGITVEAAEAVFALPLGSPPVSRVLGVLWERSLVTSRAGRDRRLVPYESTLTFAAARLAESGGTVDAEARHLRWCVAFGEARAGELEGPGVAEALAALGEERDNLLVAHARALWTDPEASARLAIVLYLFDRDVGGLGRVREILERTVDAAPAIAPDLRGRLLLARSDTRMEERSGLAGAEADIEAALVCGQEGSDPGLLARGWWLRSVLRQWLGDLDGSEVALAQAAAWSDLAPDEPHLPSLRGARSYLYLRRGRLDDARTAARAGIEEAERRRSPRARSGALLHEVTVLRGVGDLCAAVRVLRRVVEDCERDSRPAVAAMALQALAVSSHEAGDLESALVAGRQSLELNRRQGNRRGTTDALAVVGLVLHDLGRLEEAAELLEEAVELGRTLDVTAALANALGNLGRVRWSLGDLREAERLHVACIAWIDRMDHDVRAAQQRVQLAALRACGGDPDEAERILLVASRTLAEAGHPHAEALCGLVRAHVAAARARLAGEPPPDLEAALATLDRTDPDVRFLAERLAAGRGMDGRSSEVPCAS